MRTNTSANQQRGAVAAEFVLVLPILLAIVLGTIDWGWYFSVREVALNAARTGARVGSLLNNAPADGVPAATAALGTMPGCVAASVAPTIASGVRIQVTCSQVVLTKFFPASLIPRTLAVSAETRHE